jgi:methanethiol S-methyltransferase
MLQRTSILIYGVICYAVFFATLLYAIGFLGNFGVPKTIDSGLTRPVFEAIAIDLGLLGLFAAQHSIMARKWFKDGWTRFVPKAAERSTYVLFSSAALLILFFYWEPIGMTIWRFEDQPSIGFFYSIYAAGLLLVLVSTFLIDHFDLFGLRQVWIHFRGGIYTSPRFRTPALYSMVRHPLYLGWLLAFWATPVMTMAHLVFAVMTTVYILMAIQWEESDLARMHGDAYRAYKESVPMILPVRVRAASQGNPLGPSIAKPTPQPAAQQRAAGR